MIKVLSELIEKQFPSARWKPSDNAETGFELERMRHLTPWLTIDPLTLDSDVKTPIVRQCRPIVVTLHPGQVLYLPALWFHSVFQKANSNGLCVAVNYWYDMDFTGPLYPLFNFLRNVSMIEDRRSEEIKIDTD